jgi:hypothetical protein
VLEAAIAEAAAAITRDELADILGWPLTRLLTALAELERHLDSRGTRLDADADIVYGLRPRPGLLTETAARGLYAIALLGGDTPSSPPPSALRPQWNFNSRVSCAADPQAPTSSPPTTSGSPCCVERGFSVSGSRGKCVSGLCRRAARWPILSWRAGWWAASPGARSTVFCRR